MKNKKLFKASTLAVILLLITGLTYCGASPLFKQINNLKKAEIAINNTGDALAINIRCFDMLSSDLDKLDNLRSELSEIEGNLGVYKYPDTNLVTTIDYGRDFSENIHSDGTVNGKTGFIPYEYNSGLDKLQLLKIQEGEMFEFKAYKVGEEVPVAVTENDYFKLGDKIKLNLNVSNSNEMAFKNAEPVSVNAVVCGIVKKNVYLPALQQYKFSETKYFSQINELIWIFTPDLSEYTKLFDYQPLLNSGESVKFYTLSDKSVDPAQYSTVINKYGFYNANESMNVFGASLHYEINDLKENNVEFTAFSILTIYFVSAICLIKEIIMIFYKKKD